jgi:hypothetical protein
MSVIDFTKLKEKQELQRELKRMARAFTFGL